MTKTTESKWRALIAAQERSGMTVRAFSEARGIVPATMYWWRNRLRRHRERIDLVPVEVVENAAVPDRHDSEHAGFELQLEGAVTLRVPAGFDESDLRRLIRALRC